MGSNQVLRPRHGSARRATYVDKIFRGVNPAELPIEQPTKFDLVVNHKTAKTLDLNVPDKLLTRPDSC